MKRVLVAGVGNVLLGDDGFGVAVARRLEHERLPEGTRVADFGIRGVHLAFELLDAPDLLVLVDATSRGGAPGTLYVIDPEAPGAREDATPDAHGMEPTAVLACLSQMGGAAPKTRIVGCEPLRVDEVIGLSDVVARAIEPAVEAIRRLIESEVGS